MATVRSHHPNIWACSPKPRMNPHPALQSEGVLLELEYSWGPPLPHQSPFSPYRTRAGNVSFLLFPCREMELPPTGGLQHFWPNPALGLFPNPVLYAPLGRPLCLLPPPRPRTENGSHSAPCPAARLPPRPRDWDKEGTDRVRAGMEIETRSGMGRESEAAMEGRREQSRNRQEVKAGGRAGGQGRGALVGRMGSRRLGALEVQQGPLSPFPEAAGIGVIGFEGSSQPQAQGQEEGAQRWRHCRGLRHDGAGEGHCSHSLDSEDPASAET